MRWSADGKTVAAVDAGHVRVRAREARRWAVELQAPPGSRFVDVSLVAKAVLLEGSDGRRKLVSLEDGRALFPRVLDEAPWARLTEDGTKLLAVEADPGGGLAVPWFLDLETGKKQQIWIPIMSASGGNPQIVWHRRNALEVYEGRLLVAFVDIRSAPRPGTARYVAIDASWAESEPAEEDALLRGADIDSDFHTVVVAKASRSEADGAVRIEVHGDFYSPDEMIRAYHSRILHHWLLEAGSFRALWLSPEGSRLILRTRRRGKTTNGVWSTRTGKRLRDIPLDGDCFDFSPDGKLVGEKRGDDLALLELP